MLNQIKKMNERIERTEDVLENRKHTLDRLVRPIFKAATPDITWGVGFDNIVILKDEVVIGYSHYADSTSYISIPKEVFESGDPVQAAKDWHDESTRQRKIKDRKDKKIELLQRLTILEEEEDET